MAKYGSNSVTINFDNSGGTPVNMSDYILTINGVDIEAILEESHSFGKSWREFLATGIRQVGEITLGGFYDDTASSGPDAIFNAVASGPSAGTRTLQVVYGGGKSTSVECVIKAYNRRPVRGELTKFEVVLAPSGQVTEA